MRVLRSLFIAAGIFGCLFALRLQADKKAGDQDRVDRDKTALAPLQDYVGGWRGVGQPKRGSIKGAWSEQADWRWEFQDDGAAIVF
ncbi:MAG: hypothetical protein N2C14_10405, partial [Planctomycetales bacterium]